MFAFHKEMKSDSYPTLVTKISSNVIEGSSGKTNPIEFPENIEMHLHVLRLGSDVLNGTPKNINKKIVWPLKFFASKGTLQQEIKVHRRAGNICRSHTRVL